MSVVVPVHDGAGYLADTLQAVADQTEPPAEVIVVDDGSRDDSAAIARRVLPSAQIVQRAVPGGVSDARNAGLALASQPYVCFLDQDDIWHPQHLARQLAAFARHPDAGAVVCPYFHWYPGPNGYPEPAGLWPMPTPDREDPAFSGWTYHQFLLDCWALTSATMIRRRALDAVGAFDAARPYGEDWELWLRLSRGWPFVMLLGAPVLYRQHQAQGSRRARDVDHRSELLLNAAAEHGLASRDGRAVPPALFKRTVARYEMEFGLHHLRHGDAVIARRALWQAWQRDRPRWRYLALAAAASAGWRPRDAVLQSRAGVT